MADAVISKGSFHRSQAVEEKSRSWGSLRRFFSCKCQQTVMAARSKQKKNKGHEPYSVSLNSSMPSYSSSPSSFGGSFRGIPLRSLSVCYECHLVVDPARGVSMDPSLRTPTLFSCSDCEESFTKADTLELHQSVAHAVSNLGCEETGRRIVEIIFQSSWLKKQSPLCKIQRILKINNTKKTTNRFEEYRDTVICKARKRGKKQPRCIADGNELLRFHCTSIKCNLGLHGSTSLCHGASRCNVCSIIRDGFKADGFGLIRTMATSGRAHDVYPKAPEEEGDRAMLVCRVLAGRVGKGHETGEEECDSVAGSVGLYSSLDELFVFDTRAILPCFVVIYTSLE
ncbi:hypothetical protein HPP92_004005 [Vanilla planifolia]|uniref:C2H2-type domain-containing protein n=1 Tax=Vanilla planifolia TaxID=51239 RepID=A0A835VP20_VANPL|nr:hypothetical protein HPP92_027809 [Vanilla planifolia]KAG0503933.1 hypothetical protein HPP92_004005 [Vanilla planifolia]